MTDPFGTQRKPARLGFRRGRSRIPVTELLHAAKAVEAALTSAQDTPVTFTVDGETLHLIEDERSLTVQVADLARDMERARVTPTSDGLRDALLHWVDQRPPTTRDAAAAGVAALGWADDRQRRLAWTVMVPRPRGPVRWIPAHDLDASDVFLVRESALERSRSLPLSLTVADDVALFSTPDVPTLSTAALANSKAMVKALSDHGLGATVMHLVLSPPGPVACAPERAARRLAEGTNEPHLMVPWTAIDEMGWA